MILIQLSFLPDIGDRKCFHLDFPFLISGEMAAAEMPAGAVNIPAHFPSNSNIYSNRKKDIVNTALYKKMRLSMRLSQNLSNRM